ncbi:putative reverse transcriptase domain-containing protein [Tanacetum coccineum]
MPFGAKKNDVYLDEIENQNDLLKDQLLEASLTEDIKNLVITSCVEIRNKDLHDEIERISKESKDVSNESKTVERLYYAFESNGINDGIAFEIALQHKSRENNSLKTVQKENENFMASLQLENAHLKQTYKDLFESVQRNCGNKGPATRSNLQPVLVTCHACGEKGHYRNQCPKANNNAHGRAYLLRNKNAHHDPNVVTGMFLLNHHLARVLFDSGADKSFVSISISSILNIPPIIIDTTYDIEMADGNLVGTNTVIQGCTLILNQPFKIDLMPIKLGSFDVVIGMDWLSKYHARNSVTEKKSSTSPSTVKL